MKLYGSTSSPFVRRLRLFLAGHSYDFVTLNIFEAKDRDLLTRLNPTHKIPMLQDDQQVVFDSGVIYRYLSAKLKIKPLDWTQENTLTTINAANDSLVELLLCKRSGFNVEEDKLFFKLQRDRVAATLQVLNDKVRAGEFQQWNYLSISLYCLVDWVLFRELVDMSKYPSLTAFRNTHENESDVALTDPRHG
jgi:glutathione S-transferase